ncbi:MAG: trypsin-like serine protease [Vicinamibacterales bacterium]
MSRSRLVRITLTAALTLMVSAAVMAVRFGDPDNGEHPYVGLIVFSDTSGTPQWRCTGTLIAPTVMLTAGHCTELNGPARVWFQEKAAQQTGYPFSGGITGRAYTYPGWQGGLYLPDTGDTGVVVLDQAVSLPFYPPLAPAGYLDDLATARGLKDVNFKVVGYGLQSVKPQLSSVRDRLKAWVQLVDLRSALTDGFNIQTTNAQGKGTGGGGTCFGDSGGAIFTGTNHIVAVNSFVLNDNCAGASFGYRVDQAAVQSWIATFIP